MDYRVLKGRNADQRGGGSILRLTERVLRSESTVLAWLYFGVWGIALVYILRLFW